MLPDRTREHLLLALQTTPRVLRRIIAPFPGGYPVWDIVVPGRFTAREHIAHLADWEEVFYERAAKTIEQDQPDIPNPDETEMAIERGFAVADPHERLEIFRERRARLVALFRELGEEQWSRAGMHPKNGPMTLEAQAVHILGHDGYHLDYLVRHLV
ncbi:MAG: DinB family protein [Fimbriimonadaceae bacterium]